MCYINKLELKPVCVCGLGDPFTCVSVSGNTLSEGVNPCVCV